MVPTEIHIGRTVPANKPDIILRHNAKRRCKLIEVSVSAVKTPEGQRRGQKAEIARMWGVKTETIPVIVEAIIGSHATLNKRKFKRRN